ASIVEDVVVIFVLLFMLFKPLAFFFLFAGVLVLVLWLMTKIARGLKLFLRRFVPGRFETKTEPSRDPSDWALDQHSR
ncbi:MAG: hypothetical protein VYE18_03605, partial [Pseudomonadota bacterium]|nr:hypothetical protein [Pseudomonadota bacterium]